MNLTKLFNLDYLLQNIKKSKMAILLYILVVPVFTTLMILTLSDFNVYDYTSLSVINIIGMYIIPFLLSVTLFGYVYKKKSVDFIGSMPLSRKTIFATNTIGGIVLILLTQLLTLIATYVVALTVDKVIFSAMIWDIFLYQTVAYIYVFTIANLAMSFSGTLMTQIAVTALIVFFVPVSYFFIQAATDHEASVKLMGSYLNVVYDTEGLTAPVKIAEYAFDALSLGKMLVLSSVYIIIGYIMFNKRKMEVAGEAFLSQYMHIIVKSLTLLPFVLITIALNLENAHSIIVLGIIVVYWFLYDLITSKKIELWKNAVALLIAFVALYGVYRGIPKINASRMENYTVEDFNKMEISYRETSADLEDTYVIQDKAVIQNLLNSNRSEEENTLYLDCILYTNVDKLSYNLVIPMELFESLSQYKVEAGKIKLGQNARVVMNSELANSDTRKEILEIVKGLTPRWFDTSASNYVRTNYLNSVEVYEYKDHMLWAYEYRVDDSTALRNIMDKICNVASYEYLSSLKSLDYNSITYIYDKNNTIIGNTNYSYDNGVAKVKIKDFILANKAEEVDYSKDFASILVKFKDRTSIYFRTNNVEELMDILKKNNMYREEGVSSYESGYEVYYEMPGEPSVVVTEVLIRNSENTGEIIEVTSGDVVENVETDVVQ